MRKAAAATLGAGALFMTALAPSASAEPNDRACANPQPHGTERAHATVPHRTAGNHQAHMSIPHFCAHEA